ncbi:MAG TPA: hypothetical protein VM009_05670 [Terriglobales bacterium]|nr:hypothetical protein [Terriglobales bacterium]
MPALSPIQVAIAVIAVVSIVGVIISTMRKSSLLAGYGDYRHDIEKIASTLKLEMFRDGDDVVLTGNHKLHPIQIRFSYSETTPGLNIRMQAPVSFTFSVVPKGATSTEGRVLVRTGDEMFDARFAARTDHPTQAKMLVTSKPLRVQMEKLCCSSKTFLTLTTGNIELSELIIPQPYTARHVMDHLDSMSILANAVDDIPGAEKIKIVPYVREKSTPIFRIAVAIGAITALAAIFVMQAPNANAPLEESSQPLPVGIMPVDMPLILNAERWHAATADDFLPEVLNWMRSYGVDPEGRFELDVDSGAGSQDVAYFLSGEGTQRRVVLLQNRENVYDSVFPDMVAVVRVPRSSMQSIEWKKKPSADPDGDGLLIIRGTSGNLRGVVVFMKEGHAYSGNPVTYENIGLK